MASHPPAHCCTVGVKHTGTPSGRTTKIAEGKVDAYVAAASGAVRANSAILLLTDVLGLWQNSQLLADQFAANGYHTLVPDLFNGDPISMDRPMDVDTQTWIKQGSDGKNPHTTKEIDLIVEAAIKYLKTLGYSKIGTVGYCFGAKYVCRFLAGKGVDVGYIAHPSWVSDEELSAIQGPLSISAAETDRIFPAELRYKSEALLVRTKQPYQINLFSGVAHGFASRYNPSDRVARFAKEQAFLQAVAWFHEYLT